jgi:PAS domain S-box-containing protein
VSNADTKADVARGDPEDVPPLPSSSQIGNFIKWSGKRHTALLHEAGYLLLGLISLAAVTGLYYWLDVPLVAAAFTYLVVLVLLSLVSNLSSLTALSFIGICCLSYFFAPPIYSFRVDSSQDLITISGFVITSFVVNFMVTKVRAEQRVRKLAEQALRESEYKLRQIIETMPSLVWSADPNFEATHLNQRHLDYYGKQLEDFKRGGWKAFQHPDDLPKSEKAISHAVQTGTSFQVVHRIRRADGEFRWHDSRGEPLRDQQGNIIQWYGLTIDVDEAKKAEEALRESEARARAALDGIAGQVAVLAPNGEVEAANRQFLEYFGRSLEWVKNWETNGGLHPEDFPRVVELFKKAMASGIPFNFELRRRRFDGEYRWFENRGVPIRDDTGRIARWYVLLTDIEDRKQALAQLEQMQWDFAHMNRVSVMGELAASLSHEITQPIASARNNARAAQNFLDMQPPNLSEVREALSCVVGDTDRAGAMIDRIRDHIKNSPPRKEHFDLNEAINEVIALARNAIIKNSVSVQARLSEGLCPMYCDRVQLQQVVLNLVLNAVEAMGSVEAEPRELLISTEQDYTGVLVAVCDSGPGIDPTHLEHVFDRFYTTKSSGMGMGLSICRSIVEAHGGRLWATKCEPRGALFQFTIPAHENIRD